MTFAIETEKSGGSSDKAFTFPTAMQWDPEQRPRLLFRSPLGRRFKEWQIRNAEYEDQRQSFLEETELPSVEAARQTALQATDGEVLFASDFDDKDGPELEEIDDDTRILTIEGVRERIALVDFDPPDDLREWMIAFCVDHTIGSENLPVQDGDGEVEIVDWSDGDRLEALFGKPASDARWQIIESFGATGWERKQIPFGYAHTIANESGIDHDQKKD